MTVTSHSSQRALDESRWKMLAILELRDRAFHDDVVFCDCDRV